MTFWNVYVVHSVLTVHTVTRDGKVNHLPVMQDSFGRLRTGEIPPKSATLFKNFQNVRPIWKMVRMVYVGREFSQNGALPVSPQNV